MYYEPVADNEYLQDFYADIKKYSFAMQVYLLNRRFQQQQQIIWAGAGGVQDRTIYEDSVFARMLRNAGLMVTTPTAKAPPAISVTTLIRSPAFSPFDTHPRAPWVAPARVLSDHGTTARGNIY